MRTCDLIRSPALIVAKIILLCSIMRHTMPTGLAGGGGARFLRLTTGGERVEHDPVDLGMEVQARMSMY